MAVSWQRGVAWGLVVASSLLAGCSREARKVAEAGDQAPAATPRPSATVEALLRDKVTDEEYQQAIAALDAADVNADVEIAVKNDDRRLLGIRAAVVEAPGVEGDRRALPEGVRIVAVAGTNSLPGNKYQQRFQMLARMYAEKYNPLLLTRLRQR